MKIIKLLPVWSHYLNVLIDVCRENVKLNSRQDCIWWAMESQAPDYQMTQI